MTLAEKILWAELRSKKLLGFKFRKQFPVYDYIVDFYSYDLNLIIEIDGPIHDLTESEAYDKKRDACFKINGYKVIRLSNEEVISDIKSTISKLKTFINNNFVPLTGGPQGVYNWNK